MTLLTAKSRRVSTGGQANSLVSAGHGPYIQPMPRKPIELPPAVARAFVRDMKASTPGRTPSSATRSLVGRCNALRNYQGPREKPVGIPYIKEMFLRMRDE